MPLLAAPVSHALRQVADQWQTFGLLWHGSDGSVWDLVNPEAGVVADRAGIKGLAMPKFDRYTTSTPASAGSQYRGSRTQEREALLPIFIYAGSTSDWLSLDRAFWSTMRPDAVGRLELKDPTGVSRFLDLRFVDDNDQMFARDPAQDGWSVYALSLIADDQPYWYSTPVERRFEPAADEPFFLDSGGVVHISPGSTTDSAFIPNPGDVHAWVTWVIAGAVAGAVLGAGGGSVVVPELAGGEVWTIDTRPDHMTVIDQAGVDRSGEVEWNPAPIAPGAEVELAIDLDTPDGASVTCSLTPLYFRAW